MHPAVGSDIIALIIKKVYQYFNRNSTAGRRFHSCHCGIFRVWCNCRFIFTGRIPLQSHFFIDTVIESLNLCKYFTIISKNAEPICNYINAELNHGATIYDARGAYTKDNKQVVMTVVKTRTGEKSPELCSQSRSGRIYDDHQQQRDYW